MNRINKITICNEYINELKNIKNLSENSIKVYSSVIREFYGYKWDKEGLNKFMSDVKSQKANTKARKITIIKNFLNYCFDNGKIKNKFWEDLRAPREQQLPKYLTENEVKAIILNSQPPYMYIFDFISRTGLRVSELYNIDVQQDKDGYIIKIKGKGNKERNLRVNPEIYELYLKFKDEIPSIRSIQRNITAAAKKALITKPVTVHKLRHSFAITLINKGVSLNIIQSVLGHTNLSTTGIYTKVSGTEILLK